MIVVLFPRFFCIYLGTVRRPGAGVCPNAQPLYNYLELAINEQFLCFLMHVVNAATADVVRRTYRGKGPQLLDVSPL